MTKLRPRLRNTKLNNRTSSASKYLNCLYPLDKFMVLEKKSTIQKNFGEKKFKMKFKILEG